MKTKINSVIAKIAGRAPEDIHAGLELHGDLRIGWAESIDLEAILEGEMDMELPDNAWSEWVTVGDVYRYYGVAA